MWQILEDNSSWYILVFGLEIGTLVMNVSSYVDEKDVVLHTLDFGFNWKYAQPRWAYLFAGEACIDWTMPRFVDAPSPYASQTS